jgi:inosose dehydratase
MIHAMVHPPLAPSNSSRRAFLRQISGAGCLGAWAALSGCQSANPSAAAAGAKPKTLIGSNIYGWGQYYQRDKKTLDTSEVMSALRDAGYNYLEAFMDTAAPEKNGLLADQMKAKGLVPVTLYTGARLHEPSQAKTVVQRILAAAQVCRQAGFECLSCNADPIGREKTDDELKNQAAALTDLGQGLRDIGLRLGLHHHLPEMANHAREFHDIFRHTDPRLVGFCYDVHWVFRGGIPPMDALREYGDRVVSWHLRQSRGGIWWEDLDEGDIDYAAVAQYAKAHRLPRRFTVELALEAGTKITRSGVENHRRCREFVRRVFET